jgi:hypothetical protein
MALWVLQTYTLSNQWRYKLLTRLRPMKGDILLKCYTSTVLS